jgi:hypothetical protein
MRIHVFIVFIITACRGTILGYDNRDSVTFKAAQNFKQPLGVYMPPQSVALGCMMPVCALGANPYTGFHEFTTVIIKADEINAFMTHKIIEKKNVKYSVLYE